MDQSEKYQGFAQAHLNITGEKTTVATKSDFLSYPPSPISPLLKIITV